MNHGNDPSQPARAYHPRFVLWTSFLAQIPFQLFFSFWAGGFFGGLFQVFMPDTATVIKGHGINPFALVGVSVLVGFPVITLILKKLNYANTTYQVYTDRLVIEEGFLTQHRKEISLSAVREVNLRRGVLQRMVGLGSVYIATQATGVGTGWAGFSALGNSSTFGSGALLRDLDDAPAVYALLAPDRVQAFA